MKYREDITNYLIANHSEDFKQKEYKVFEQNGILYDANYEWKMDKISYYSDYSYLYLDSDLKIMKAIEKKFDVKFVTNSDIICGCGESKSFSANWDETPYIRCNNCGNKIDIS